MFFVRFDPPPGALSSAADLVLYLPTARQLAHRKWTGRKPSGITGKEPEQGAGTSRLQGVTRQRMARNAKQPGWHKDPARMAKRTTAGCGKEYLPEGGAGSRMPPYQDDAGTARWNGKGKTREASGQGMQGAIRFKE